MNPLSTLEAYDLLRHCARLSDRLAQAEAEHLSREGLEPEKRWLSEANALVAAQLTGVDELLARARELPELDVVREDYSEELQETWVDCLERLHAGLILHAGSRAPILETLFPHMKFPALRRASGEGVRAFAADFDRRSRLGYVKRILGQPDYAFAEPLFLAVPETLERWEACFRPSEMSEEDAMPLRAELAEAAYRVERFMRQGRLLAEAALAPIEGAFDSSGIGRWPRRRIGFVETEAPEPLDGAPHDDGVSLPEALNWGSGSGATVAAMNGEGTGDADTQAADGAATDEARPSPAEEQIVEAVAPGGEAAAANEAGEASPSASDAASDEAAQHASTATIRTQGDEATAGDAGATAQEPSGVAAAATGEAVKSAASPRTKKASRKRAPAAAAVAPEADRPREDSTEQAHVQEAAPGEPAAEAEGEMVAPETGSDPTEPTPEGSATAPDSPGPAKRAKPAKSSGKTPRKVKPSVPQAADAEG